MPGIDDMGVANADHGICGFTSTLYMVHKHRPGLHAYLDRALGDQEGMRDTRLQAEIKTFLRMMQAKGAGRLLKEIQELTSSFPGYKQWRIESYIDRINKRQADADYSIAMPPRAVAEYVRTMWQMRAYIEDRDVPGDAILGLTRTGMANRWKNLAHYVFRDRNGRLYSWGEQFDDLAAVNAAKGRDYSVVHRIMLHG